MKVNEEGRAMNLLAIAAANGYTDNAVAAIAGGLRYKGSVATSTDLPSTGNTLGDYYTCADTGHEWVWTSFNSVEQWLDLDQDLTNYIPKADIASAADVQAIIDDYE